MKVFLAIVLLAVSASAARRSFTTPLQSLTSTRIIGGELATAGQFPHQAAVRMQQGASGYFCGGSLISGQWVLSAAHCAYQMTSFTIHLGIINVNNADPELTFDVLASDAIVHAGYNTNNLNNDVSLIRLPVDVPSSGNVMPIPLVSRASANNPWVGATPTVSGWGKISDSSSGITPDLNFVALNVIANPDCAAVYGTAVVVDSTICCVGNPSESTCNGDSGGPLIINDGGTNVQIGTVSFVHVAGCASGNPSGYVRTGSMLDWIEQNSGVTPPQ